MSATGEPPPPAERPFRRLSPLTPLVRSFILVVAVAGGTWRELISGELGPLGWILLGVLAAGAVYGTASWLRTKYWIEDDELRVDTGVVSRQSRRIRVDRLQGIDIVQPFVARLFGLAELKMDVAGGGRAEGSLAFLPLAEAHSLRDVLLARRDAVRASVPAEAPGPGHYPPPAGGGYPQARPAAPPERVLARLDLRLLVAGLLLSAETGAFVVSVVAFAALFFFVGGLAGASGLLPVVAGFALLQARKLAAYYDFTVAETASGLQVSRGLLDRNAQSIALARVQGVVITEPWLWRQFGWARLDVCVAGYAPQDSGRPDASTVMPVAPLPRVLELARYLLRGIEGSAPGVDPAGVRLVPPPERARWVAPVRRRAMAAGLDPDLLVGREGVVTRRTHVVPHARVQSVRLSQGWWQRRLGLADVHVDSPPGPVHARARHRDAAEARALFDEAGRLACLARHR